MPHKSGFVGFAVAALAIACCRSDAYAADVRARLPENWSWSTQADGPMCGVYAVCRSLAILGTPVEPVELWKVGFVGNSRGSAPDELIAALREHGSNAELRSGLTYPELCSLAVPVIANVRNAPEEKQFNHWVCLQSTDKGLTVYDGPNAGRLVTPAEFLATFSGIGLVVSNGQEAGLRISLVRLFGMANVLAVTYLILTWRPKSTERRQDLSFSIRRMGTATLASLAIGVLFYGPCSGHWDGVAIAAAPYYHPDVKSGSLQDVIAAAQNSESLVVDARMEQDYLRGTIGNAVNIPVHADYQEIKQFLRDVPKSVPIVVFCQSKTCEYDEAISGKLAGIGFRDVTVSDLGYAEYRQSRTEK